MFKVLISSLAAGAVLFAALPATTNYKLNSYGFGSGGTANSGTSNYSLEGLTGEISGQTGATTNFQQQPGFVQTQQANVPKVSLTNANNNYDKLKFVIDTQNNPTDALYALQVKAGDTSCDFSSGTINYVKSDLTVGASLTLADYQTYAAWGGAGGSNIIGLSPNTTYCLRAKATQGKYTESAYGPSASAATSTQQISFCLYTGASCVGSPNTISLSGLLAGTVTSSANINVSFATNANSGGNVYIYDLNNGLKSPSAGNFILASTSAGTSADLSSAGSGYGAQIQSVSQTSGGPVNKVAPYNGSGNSVGALSPTVSTLLSASSPISGGSAAINLQAKASNTTPEATDYADTLTVVAAANF